MSKQRNFRTKLSFEDDEEEAPVIVRPSKDKKKDKQKKSALLSFGGDEDDSGPSNQKKEPKPSKFHRPDANSHAAAHTSTYTQRASAGEYTAERLAELQKQTQRIPSSKPSSSTAAAGSGIIKLQGSFKPASAPKDDRFTMPPPAALVQPPQQPQQQQHEDDDGEMLLPPPPRPSSRGAAAAQQQQEELSGSDGEADDGMIPDEEAIRLAKAKRERLRQAHLAPDYIPLGGPTALASADYKQAEAAVHSGSDDEQEEHIRMGFLSSGQQQQAAAAARRKTFASSIEAEDDGEDFAAAQMRKAISKNQAGGRAGAAAAAPAAAVPAAASLFSIPARGYDEQVQQQAAAAAKALQDAVKRMQMGQKQAEQNLARTAGNLQTSLDAITRIEREQSAAADKYAALQEFRGYISDLLDCLQHKSVIVEELEDRVYELLGDRAAGDREQQQLEQRELLEPADAAIQAGMGVLARGGELAAAAAAAESAAQACEQQMLSSAAPTELDEFGRNINLMKQREGQERAAKRRKLVAAAAQELQHVRQGGSYDLSEASSRGGSEEGSSSRYSMRRKEISEAAATVFADAAEEFGSLAAVKKRLEQFKSRYPKEYQNAYLPLSIPAMLAPYVRLELLAWDPLHTGQPSFDQQAWYQHLFDYGMGPEQAAAAQAAAGHEDPDLELVPQLVKKLVLPLVMHLVSRCWLPASAAQTKVVAALLGDLLVYVPAEDERMVELLGLVKGSLEEAVAAVAVPHWPPAATAAYPAAEGVAAVAFKRALQLLQGLGSFEGLLARSWLQPLALGELLQQQLLPHLRAATGELPLAVARAEAVVQSLCLEWFAAAGGSAAAAGLVEFMSTVALLLEGQRGDNSAAGLSAKVKRSLVQRLAACMGSVGDDAGRRRLLHVYGIRE